MITVRVKFLRGTSLGDGIDAAVGEVVDLDRRLFAQFAQQGRVVEVPTAPAPAPAVTEAAPATEAAPPLRKGRKNA